MLDREIVAARSQAVWEKHRVPVEFPSAVLASGLGLVVSHLAIVNRRRVSLPVETHNRRILAEVEVRLAKWFKKIVPTVAVDCKDLALIAGKAHNLDAVTRNEQAYHDHHHSHRNDSEHRNAWSREPQDRRLDYPADTNYFWSAFFPLVFWVKLEGYSLASVSVRPKEANEYASPIYHVEIVPTAQVVVWKFC